MNNGCVYLPAVFSRARGNKRNRKSSKANEEDDEGTIIIYDNMQTRLSYIEMIHIYTVP